MDEVFRSTAQDWIVIAQLDYRGTVSLSPATT